MPLFDCHSHIGASDSGELYYGRLEGAEYLKLMEASGIDQAISFPPLRLDGYAQSNRALADWCESGGAGRVRPLARVGGKRIGWTEPKLWLLRRKLRRLIGYRPPDLEPDEVKRFAGLKILPHLDGLPPRQIVEANNDLGQPMLTHAGRFVPAWWIKRTILPMVRTKLVVAHLGAFPSEPDLLDQAIDLAAEEDRVYLDTSGIWDVNFLQQAVERIPEKLMFGSDCPLTHPRVAWQLVESVVKHEGLRERIGREAAEEVFG